MSHRLRTKNDRKRRRQAMRHREAEYFAKPERFGWSVPYTRLSGCRSRFVAGEKFGGSRSSSNTQ